MTDKKKIILTLILFGSMWGGLEAIVTTSMGGVGTFIPRSVVLAFVALLVISYGRYILPMRGSTILIGLVACGFKFLSLPNILFCQIAGVLGQALMLEIAFTLAYNRGWFKKIVPMAAVVVVSSFANCLFFSFSQAFIFQNHWWLDRGLTGLLNWSFTIGSMAALASLIGFVISYLIVKVSLTQFERFAEIRRVAYMRTAAAVSICFWFIGVLLINETVFGSCQNVSGLFF